MSHYNINYPYNTYKKRLTQQQLLL